MDSADVILEDMSTNGCVLNESKEVRKGEKVKLNDGDSVSVGRKLDGDKELGFSFTYRAQPDLLDQTLPVPSEFNQPTSGVEAKKEPEQKPEEKPTTSTTVTEKSGASDEIAENLTCSICCELIHDCIALQPCMHSFCGGCYSEWMERSNKCPDCRNPVDRIAKNHLMNNVIQAYLKDHPDKRRSSEEMKELDEKNKITKDMLEPPRKRRRRTTEDEDDDNEEEEDEEERDSEESDSSSSSTEEGNEENYNALANVRFGTTVAGALRWMCRQCPGQERGDGRTLFRCARDQNHALCQCCTTPFPDRRAENNPNLPPTQCTLCQGLYCHQYWGCRRPGCTGCLAQFKNLKFGTNTLGTILMGNSHESQIFEGYLARQGKDEKDLFRECLVKQDAGNMTLSQIKTSSFLCYHCGLKQFQELAYQYRMAIPAQDLPIAGTRPDCHWGRNCRTQRTKPHHAQNFNHLCEQTKFNDD